MRRQNRYGFLAYWQGCRLTSTKTVWCRGIGRIRRCLRECRGFEIKQGLNPEKQEDRRVFGEPYVARMEKVMGFSGGVAVYGAFIRWQVVRN